MALFKRCRNRRKPSFPISSIESLSLEQRQYLIKRLHQKLERYVRSSIEIIPEIIEFQCLITERLIKLLEEKKEGTKIEIETINALFKKDGLYNIEFLLLSEIANSKNSEFMTEFAKDRKMKLIEGIAYVRIQP